ncbi:MAG: VPLPA-CTERM sorting domain-containing protein [Pseudomonadota bacterium]
MKTMVIAAAAATVLGGAVSASTYTIDGLINISEFGFGSSLIHEQDYDNDMSGSTVAYFDEAASGTWMHDGSIEFTGTWNGFGYTATGNIDQTTAGGDLTFDFESGSQFDMLTFYFDGDLDMGLPNSFDGQTIFLWGGTNTCATTDTCYGTDLRISVSQVPVPASALLLLGGLGAFAAVRRKTS